MRAVRSRLGLLVTVMLPLTATAAPARVSPEPLLKALEKLTTYQAEFVQELHIPEFESVQTAAGTLFVARPERFLLNFSSPVGDMMMGDGEHVWIYSAENRQAIKQSLDLSAGFRTFMLDFDDLYRLEVLDSDADGMWRVRLIPKTGEKQVEDLILWFDNDTFLLQRLEYLDLNLNRTIYNFSEIQVNRPIDAGRFTFKPPPGTEIFENY